MDTLKNAQAILDHINRVVNGNGLVFDANGVASLAIEENIVCLFCVLENEKTLVTTLYLGRIDQSDPELLYEMLCGNYMGAYTAGGTLGIDAEEGLIALHQHFPLPVEEPAWIEEPLAALVGAARYWRDRMMLKQSGSVSGAPQDPAGGFLRV